MILINITENPVGEKSKFISEWLNSNILFIYDLLNSNSQFMSCQEIKNQYACKTNFLQFYQVLKRNFEAPSNESKQKQHLQKANHTLRTPPYSN